MSGYHRKIVVELYEHYDQDPVGWMRKHKCKTTRERELRLMDLAIDAYKLKKCGKSRKK